MMTLYPLPDIHPITISPSNDPYQTSHHLGIYCKHACQLYIPTLSDAQCYCWVAAWQKWDCVNETLKGNLDTVINFQYKVLGICMAKCPSCFIFEWCVNSDVSTGLVIIVIVDFGSMITRGSITLWYCYRSCDKLRCTGCDFNILHFNDYAWHSKCDYMFFRNNMPNTDKLNKNLVRKRGENIIML